ncbi:MAG: glutamate--tRNA ligase [Bacteroidetes bacterium]|nr:glutamate--tRNA ligase [Bacteroidota bacterium]
MEKRTRTRFAPSPTGPLHMGGVRTALYAYLFAKQKGGDFLLRIEDTDQNRFVPGAEEYIIEALHWCGIKIDEGVSAGGKFSPYRQSERKEMYRKYAEQLVESGHAYYAFDASAELDTARKLAEAAGKTFSYDSSSRMNMKNSLSLPKNETSRLISENTPHVIRLNVPVNEEIRFTDLVRGEVVFHSNLVDDKVLLKSDGMPTYHLAHIVDDVLMEITHAIRGEEWLPSAPAHILIYDFLGWKEQMPHYAHLPLLLKPDGNGKLSKRDGDRLGFPVFPLEWKDPATGEISSGYRERGYYPEAFVNMLAFLGWNPGTEQEIFSMDELIRNFSFHHVHKAGARFDPEKTKWFNQQYLHKKSDEELAKEFLPVVERELNSPQSAVCSPQFVQRICGLVKEKATFVSEFWNLSSYLFIAPSEYEQDVITKKWNENSSKFFNGFIENLQALTGFTRDDIDKTIKQTAADTGIKPGEIMQLLRVLISGRGSGVDLLGMMALLGHDEVCSRLERGLLNVKEKVQ